MLKAIHTSDFNLDIDLPVFIYNKEKDIFINKYKDRYGEDDEIYYSYEEIEQEKGWLVFLIDDDKVTQLTKSGLKVLRSLDKIR